MRLLNPTEMLSRFQIDRGVEAGLTIEDLDIDRYPIDGRLQQVLVAARSSTSTTARTRAGRAATSSTRAAAGW